MLKKLLAVSLLLLIIKPAMAMNHADYFPAVAQGHSCTEAGKTQLELQDDARINGVNNRLGFCGMSPSDGGKYCDNKACTVTGRANSIVALNEGDIGFDATSDNKKALPSFSDSLLNLSAGDYEIKKIDVDEQDITINATGQVRIFIEKGMKLEELVFTINGAVDFYVGGDFELQESALNTDGNIRFFVSEKLELEESKVISKGSLELYGKGSIKLQGSEISGEDSKFYLYGFEKVELQDQSKIDGYVYSGDTLEMESGTVNGRVTAKKIEMQGKATINDVTQGETPGQRQCFTDDFNRANLGNDWVTSKSSGTFTPNIIDGRFRLTEAKQSQATAVSYNKVFAANNNHIVIEFDHFAYVPKSANDKEKHGADGIAIVFSDADLKAYPGSAGGPLGYGYRANSPGFTGGWLGIGIDEHGNFATEGGETNKNNRERDSVTVRGSGMGFSGYNFLDRYTSPNNEKYYGESKRTSEWSWKLARTIYYSEPRAHRYRITLDTRTKGTAFVSVERNVEPDIESSKFEPIFTSFDILKDNNQAGLPENNLLLSVTGSTGTYINVHEIDNIEVCADEIADLNAEIDHFRFSVESPNPQACGEEPIVLKACANADCSEEYTGQADVKLNSSGDMQWQGGNEVEFTGSTPLKLASTGSVWLDVVSSTPPAVPFKDTLCQIGNSSYSKSNCQLSFSNNDKTIKLNLPSAYAGQTVVGELMPQKEECETLYANQEKEIAFSTEVLKPQSAEVSPKVNIKYQNKALIDNKVTVKFDKDGKAKFSFTYPEAGVVAITAKEGKLTGTANLVTIPKCLQVSADITCNEADHTCSPFKAAGEEFALTISAYGSDEAGKVCAKTSAPLKNYQQKMNLSPNLIAPSEGNEGELGIVQYLHKGIHTLTNQTFSEVGVTEITAEPEGTYEGSSLKTDKGTSAPIGRFYPYRFILDSGNVESQNDGTDIESYMAQPFTVDMHVEAVNMQGVVTDNYENEFANSKIDLQVSPDKSARISPWPTFSPWKEGRIDFNSEDIVFSRQDKPDGPYELDFKLRLSGEYRDKNKQEVPFEDTRGSSNATYQCEQDCVANPLILGKQNVRYGRVLAGTTTGSPSDSLSAPLQIEYWDAVKGDFIDFPEDNWSKFTMANVSDNSLSRVEFLNKDYNDLNLNLTMEQGVVVKAGLTATEQADPQYKVTAKDGKAYLTVNPPKIVTTVDYKVLPPPWLIATPDSHKGWLKFGVSKGNSSIIYRKESFDRKSVD